METNQANHSVDINKTRDEYRAIRARFRDTIKEHSEAQKRTKKQRQSTSAEERSHAQSMTAAGKHYLRYLYLAYGFFRGKTQEQIEGYWKLDDTHEYQTLPDRWYKLWITAYSQDLVDKILEEHGVDTKTVVYPGKK